MLHYAVIFLVIALIAAVLGFGGIAADAAELAKLLFYVCGPRSGRFRDRPEAQTLGKRKPHQKRTAMNEVHPLDSTRQWPPMRWSAPAAR